MKRIATLLLSAALLGLSVGCHAQVPPATPPPTVSLTWTAATSNSNWSGCSTTIPCTYAIYRDSVAPGTDPLTSTNWIKVATTTVANATGYVDATPPSGNIGYYVETVWSTENSGPSNLATVVVPIVQIPTAPSAVGGVATAENVPEKVAPFQGPTIAMNEPLRLKARIGR